MLINVARWSTASSPRSNICPSHNQGCWMLLIWGRGNMKAFKCLMGVGQGSGVRPTNDNVLRRAGVSASWEQLCWWVFHRHVCVSIPSSSFLSCFPIHFFPLFFMYLYPSCWAESIRADLTHRLVFPGYKKLLNGSPPHGDRQSSHTHLKRSPCPL